MSHTYEELSDLRAFPADVRVYSYVLHLLEPTVVSGNPTRQYAGQWTLDAVDRNLLPRADEFLDEATNELDLESIRMYVFGTFRYKVRSAWHLRAQSLDVSADGQHPLAARVSGDMTSGRPPQEHDWVWEEFEAHEAELAELQELAEEQAAEQADAELVRGVVREWVEAHPESFTPDDVRILAMRARKLSYWLIAATLWPSADEDGCRRAHDRARARGSRARKRLPEHVAEYLPPNTRGEVNDKQGT